MTDKDKARASHLAHVDNRNELARAARLAAELAAHEAEKQAVSDRRHQRRMQALMPVENRPLVFEFGTLVAY